MKQKIPFQSCHEGKCDTCKDTKSLDAMVMKDYTKGLYECVDCKVEKENINKDDFFSLMSHEEEKTRIKKMVGWLTG